MLQILGTDTNSTTIDIIVLYIVYALWLDKLTAQSLVSVIRVRLYAALYVYFYGWIVLLPYIGLGVLVAWKHGL